VLIGSQLSHKKEPRIIRQSDISSSKNVQI